MVGISDRDLAWAAGFLEGEGSFSFGSRRDKGHPWSGSPNVSACQKQREPLDRLHKMFGGNTPALYHKRGPLKNKDVWHWRVYGERAIGIMYVMYLCMSPRRRHQINNAVLAWLHAPGKQTHCSRGHDLRVPGARYIWRGESKGCKQCLRDRALTGYRSRRVDTATAVLL